MKNQMKKVKKTFYHILKDESAQGATEYIFLVMVIVAIGVTFRNQIKSAMENAIGRLQSNIDDFVNTTRPGN